MRFVIFLTMLFSVSISMQYYVIRRLSVIFDFHYASKIFIVFFAVTVNFIVVTMLSRRIWNLGVQIWYLGTALYIGAIWISFSLLLVFSLIQFIVPIPPKLSQCFVVGMTVLLIAYSVFNARQIVIKKIELASDKITENMTIAQLSDLHLGAVHGKHFVENVVLKTNGLQPDIVVITGDLFDGTGRISEQTLQEFKKLTAPAFFIPGNHDRFLDEDDLHDLLQKTSLHVLQDEKFLYNHSLQIVGLDYRGHQPKSELLPVLDRLALDKHYYTVLLSHVPIDFPYTNGHPVDLQLSGHTHSGQIFPFYFIVKYFYPKIRGLYSADNQNLYVSSGTGTWGPPMRLGTSSEIALILLSPQKNVAQK